jgi:hypothetical protein
MCPAISVRVSCERLFGRVLRIPCRASSALRSCACPSGSCALAHRTPVGILLKTDARKARPNGGGSGWNTSDVSQLRRSRRLSPRRRAERSGSVPRWTSPPSSARRSPSPDVEGRFRPFLRSNRWLALRGSPETDLRVHNEATSGQSLNDLANLVVRPVGIPFDQLRSCSAYGTVEHGEMDGPSCCRRTASTTSFQLCDSAVAFFLVVSGDIGWLVEE